MDDSTWQRLAAAAGIVSVSLVVISAALVPDPPQVDDSIAQITFYVIDHQSGYQAGAYLQGASAFFFLLFLGGLRSTLAQAEGAPGRLAAVVFGSGVATVALVLTAAAIAATLATRVVDEGDTGLIRAMYDLVNISSITASFPIAALVGATSTVILRTGVLARGLGLSGVVLVPAWLLVGVGLFVESGALSATGAYGLIVLAVWLVWLVALSVDLARRAGVSQAA